MTHEPAVVAHFDITGPDIDALTAFYGTVLGWEVVSRGPGYSQVSTPTLRGALAETPEPSLTIGVVVDNLEDAVAAAERMGGTTLMPPTNNGWVTKAQVTDPSGNVLTFIQK